MQEAQKFMIGTFMIKVITCFVGYLAYTLTENIYSKYTSKKTLYKNAKSLDPFLGTSSEFKHSSTDFITAAGVHIGLYTEKNYRNGA